MDLDPDDQKGLSTFLLGKNISIVAVGPEDQTDYMTVHRGFIRVKGGRSRAYRPAKIGAQLEGQQGFSEPVPARQHPHTGASHVLIKGGIERGC
ncbi:MAG: hypothetical protein IPK99_17905 [Flavobacteriales bacterium]|nr:hypothetical protein [Flavobacteriales bacterium]